MPGQGLTHQGREPVRYMKQAVKRCASGLTCQKRAVKECWYPDTTVKHVPVNVNIWNVKIEGAKSFVMVKMV